MLHPCIDNGGYRKFGWKSVSGKFHLGHDYNAPENTPILSISDGIVIFVGSVNGFGSFGREGGVVIIKHNNVVALYGHINYLNYVGQFVKQGDILGTVIKYETNNFRADHLHFGINTELKIPDFNWGYSNYINNWIDPIKYINTMNKGGKI